MVNCGRKVMRMTSDNTRFRTVWTNNIIVRTAQIVTHCMIEQRKMMFLIKCTLIPLFYWGLCPATLLHWKKPCAGAKILTPNRPQNLAALKREPMMSASTTDREETNALIATSSMRKIQVKLGSSVSKIVYMRRWWGNGNCTVYRFTD